MNIRLRNVKGESIDLNEDYRFVEILDDDAHVAAVVYLDEAKTANVLTAASKTQAKHYEKIFDVEFSANIVSL